jgi:hypothetical protein
LDKFQWSAGERPGGPFQAAKPFYCMSRFARLVHFGAIKMDIGFGIHPNVSREKTCRMKKVETEVAFRE